LDAKRRGRVVFVRRDTSPTIDGFTITGGNADDEAWEPGHGGGICSREADPIIQNNVIVSSVASVSPTTGGGGGVYLLEASASALISGNHVLSNTAHSTSWNAGGGGIQLDDSAARVQGNLMQGNRCSQAGGGIYSAGGASRILNNEVRGNRAGRNGGGIYARDREWPLIQGNLVVDNVAGWNGGGVCAAYATTPTIAANQILGNSGDGSVMLGGEGRYTMTNNVVTGNGDGGIYLFGSTRFGLIAHNTVAANAGFGILLDSRRITPTIINNIVALNAYGIQAKGYGPSGTLDYNDVWGNTIQDYDLPGALQPGPNSIQADPSFMAEPGGGFHLGAGSPCIDAGMDVGVRTDIDGDVRPVGPRVDIGADEALRRVCLPVVMRGH
jgi:parallel beta-helix repeat protein